MPKAGRLWRLADIAEIRILMKIGIRKILTCIPQMGMNIYVDKTLFIVYSKDKRITSFIIPKWDKK
ncbi:MAG: hypothetical protein AB1393_09930 [Candidatus Edwardsbacteria bacterium]